MNETLKKVVDDFFSEDGKDELSASPVEQRVMRSLGFYEVKKRGKWTRAEWTEYGWRVLWSNWYQDDNDLDGIRAESDSA